MRYTVFNTPVISPLLRGLCQLILKLKGWRIVGLAPDEARYVMVTGPHTSNWDFPYMLAVVFAARMNVRWMGKHTLFPYGLSWFMRWLGGVPVNRKAATNVVDQMVEVFSQGEHFQLLVAPEGSRSKVDKWKTGFYRIALGAKVPIYITPVCYKKRQVVLGESFMPTGNIEGDMERIQSSFASSEGKRPELGF